MDSALVGTVVLGTASATALIACQLSMRKRVHPPQIVTAFLAAGGISVGIRVCALSIDFDLRGLDEQRIYLLLAGLCMVWLSTMTTLDLYRRVLGNRHARAMPKMSGATLKEEQPGSSE